MRQLQVVSQRGHYDRAKNKVSRPARGALRGCGLFGKDSMETVMAPNGVAPRKRGG